MMKIIKAEFVKSSTTQSNYPDSLLPEFAFIGRSNVGKSSLINMLANHKGLAKTSGRPGKTQTINHFKINDNWMLVDLPGYGYAGVSKVMRKGWSKMIEEYLLKRENLICLFILIDSRLEPQKIDLEFIQWAGESGLPIVLVFTKIDKLKPNELKKNQAAFQKALSTAWEELPPLFLSSAEKKTGRKELLVFIGDVISRL
jgi:GTP-binding protein